MALFIARRTSLPSAHKEAACSCGSWSSGLPKARTFCCKTQDEPWQYSLGESKRCSMKSITNIERPRQQEVTKGTSTPYTSFSWHDLFCYTKILSAMENTKVLCAEGKCSWNSAKKTVMLFAPSACWGTHKQSASCLCCWCLTQRSSQKTHRSHQTPTYTQRCSKKNAILSSRRDWKIENSTRGLQEPPLTVFLLFRRSVTPQHSCQ